MAEEDPVIRSVLAAVLRSDGYRVTEAADGFALLELIEEALATQRELSEAFLVVTDVGIPGLTGLDVLAILRCASARTPVILVTASDDPETRVEARDLGAAHVLDKPLNIDALRAAVVEAAGLG